METGVTLKRDQLKRKTNNKRESASWPVSHWTCNTTLNNPTRDTFSRAETVMHKIDIFYLYWCRHCVILMPLLSYCLFLFQFSVLLLYQ